MTGTIKKLDDRKKFGFINAERRNYFFHRDDFQGHWNDLVFDYNGGGDIKVEFIPTEGKKGPRAENVRRIEYPNMVDGGM